MYQLSAVVSAHKLLNGFTHLKKQKLNCFLMVYSTPVDRKQFIIINKITKFAKSQTLYIDYYCKRNT